MAGSGTRGKHWGSLGDGNLFQPGTSHFYASVAEREKLIFPEGWDMGEVAEHSAVENPIIASKEPVADREGTARMFNLLEISFNDDGTVRSYSANQKKLADRLLTCGFFASKTIGLDMTPIEAKDNYGMRDEQEKCFQLQKGPMGRMKFISPFVGAQVDTCKAFGFYIPDGYVPVYVSKTKPAARKRGRPAKPKIETQNI